TDVLWEACAERLDGRGQGARHLQPLVVVEVVQHRRLELRDPRIALLEYLDARGEQHRRVDPTVVRVRNTLQEVHPLELLDDLAHRLRSNVRPPGELRVRQGPTLSTEHA